jgi:DNA-binding CsgD family transcriptional regulator
MQSDRKRPFKINDTTGTAIEDYTQQIVDLLSYCQTLGKHTDNIGEQLCKEVARVTRGRARLCLSLQNSSTERPAAFAVSVSFPVRFCNRIYGTLEVAPDAAQPGSPALPLGVAQLLAHTCGSLLFGLELSAFVEAQSRRLDVQIPGHLTRREREVLELICRGYDQQAIAKKLHIAPATVGTHRKRIYEKLGVHAERDIPLAAYRANLFSIFE